RRRHPPPAGADAGLPVTARRRRPTSTGGAGTGADLDRRAARHGDRGLPAVPAHGATADSGGPDQPRRLSLPAAGDGLTVDRPATPPTRPGRPPRTATGVPGRQCPVSAGPAAR